MKSILNKIYCYTLLVFVFSVLAIESVVAQGFRAAPSKLNELGKAVGGGQAPTSNPGAIVGQAIQVILQLVGLIFLILTVYSGILWMTSRGDEDQITKARDILITASIGLFIVLSAYSITFLITGTL